MHRHLLFIIFLFTSSVAWSQIFVDSSATTGANNGNTWINAYTSLQDALSVATAGDSIFISKGTYYPDVLGGVDSDDKDAYFFIPDGLVVLGGFNTAAGDTTLNTRDWEANATILSGDIDQTPDSLNNSYHEIVSTNTSPATLVDGVIVEKGNANGAETNQNDAGGIWLANSDMRIANLVIRNNNSLDEGGGFWVDGGNGLITNTQFISNTIVASNPNGPGASVSRGGSAEFADVDFIGNRDRRFQCGFALYQNTPNPYTGKTVIGFKLPYKTVATMTIYDVTGRVIKPIQGDYQEGYNEVRVTSTELGTTGVLYYQLDTNRYTATKKMVVIN